VVVHRPDGSASAYRPTFSGHKGPRIESYERGGSEGGGAWLQRWDDLGPKRGGQKDVDKDIKNVLGNSLDGGSGGNEAECLKSHQRNPDLVSLFGSNVFQT